MGLIKTIKMLNVINKGVDIIEDLITKNKDAVEKAGKVIEEIKTAIAYFESRKSEIQVYIDDMKRLISTIKEKLDEVKGN